MTILLVFTGCAGVEQQKPWHETYSAICHAMGKTEQGDVLTNSLEAFTYNYEKGWRVFEVDLAITSDQVVVLRHDWGSDLGQGEAFGWTDEQKAVPTAEEFLKAPILGKYTPMTLLDLYKMIYDR